MSDLTVTIEASEAEAIVARSGGWKDAEGRWHFGGGAAEHVGPFWQLDEALTVALRSIAASGELDS